MRILVTGGCGFIGSNFIRFALNQNSSDVLINFDKLTYAGNPANLADVEKAHSGDRYFFCRGDIADRSEVLAVLEEYRPDAVINFAAESHVDRSIHNAMPFVTTNIVGTQTLLEACLAAGVERFVQISTDEVYGSLGPTGKFSEQTPLDPRSPYSASKASADFLTAAFYHTHAFPALITRCSNNYGPYQFPEKLIPFMFRQAANNQPLPVYGDGLNVRDWIHVEDHCRGVWLALTKGRPGAVYNFGGDAERSNIEVVKRILQIMDKPETLIRYVKDRPGHDRRYAMDFSLAARELGFSPVHAFESGLAETIHWYQNNPEWLDSIVSGAYLEFIKQWYAKDQRL